MAKEFTQDQVKQMINVAVGPLQRRLDRVEKELRKLRSDHGATKAQVSRINRKY